MKKYTKYIITGVAACLLYLIFFTSIFKQKEQLLKNYDFDKGSWFLVKGHYNDSIQYLIDDVKILNELKDKWVLNKSDDNFATTGGYNIELYKNSERVMFMDIINDGWISMNTSGILSNSEYGTLGYSNLRWTNIYKEKWIETKLIIKQFKDDNSEHEFLDSLETRNKVYVLYHGSDENGHYMRCLIRGNNKQ